jgi:hypothetical protein
MMMNFRFGTVINGIDGRTQEVVIDHMKQKYNIDGVDMVTFPGADGIFLVGTTQKRLHLSEEQFPYR